MLAILPVICLLAAPAPAPTKGPQPPVFKFLGYAKDGALSFAVTNPNATPAVCHAFHPNSFSTPPKPGTIVPLYEMDVRKRGGPWKGVDCGSCGVGLTWIEVPAKATVKFTADLPRGDWDEARVWLNWFATETGMRMRVTAWSEPVPLKPPAPKKKP